jgi:hypothetical protein
MIHILTHLYRQARRAVKGKNEPIKDDQPVIRTCCWLRASICCLTSGSWVSANRHARASILATQTNPAD